jgi:hypothetical protein
MLQTCDYVSLYVSCVADITINQTLMDELTEEEKQEFVASNPHTSQRNVFTYDPATRKVGGSGWVGVGVVGRGEGWGSS